MELGISSNLESQAQIAVKLSAKGEQSVLQGHPWVFSKSIIKTNKTPKTGDLALIFSKKSNKIIGIGLWDADSPIQIKLIHSRTSKNIDATFFNEKIDAAFLKRNTLLQTQTTSYRLLFGENDGFPGLIADVYASTLVVKLYSSIWIHYIESIIKKLLEISKTHAVVIRLSRKLQAKNPFNLTDGTVVYGTLENEVVPFIEHGVKFTANVIKGHKTGYFLDHRHNRKQVGAWSKGKTVLDVFSYAGGFSVHALANGAAEVTSLDISKQALEIAIKNGKLNNYKGNHKTIVGDAFNQLNQLIKQHKAYDIVVIDPPSFAKQQKEIVLAKKKYAQLAQLGLKLTASNGILVLASCSSRIVAQSFFDINEQVLKSSTKNYKILLKTEHDSDHPIAFPEGAYLKCGYYKIS